MRSLLNLEIGSLFDRFIGASFCDYGPLHQPITSQTIRYTSKGTIELTTKSKGNSTSNATEHEVGTIRINSDKATMEALGGFKIEFKGIQQCATQKVHGHTRDVDELTEKSSVNEVYCKLKDGCVDDYQIEYVSNIESIYVFPDRTKTLEKENRTMDLLSGDKKFTIEDISQNTSLGMSAINLTIEGIDLYLVLLGQTTSINSAVIIYLSVQTDETRTKIRNCISFCLGKNIQYHGYLTLNSNHNFVEFSYKSNSSIAKKDSYYAQMPAPLGRFQLGLGSNETNRLVNALYSNYDKYDLQHVLWGYWHALEAPIHIAAVHFGASIEAFQAAYTKQHPQDFPKKFIERVSWKKFRKEALEIADSLELPEKDLEILTNKINNLNQTPQSLLTDRFFEKLGIFMSPLEIAAWRERNNAAHGKSVNGQYVTQIRNINILKCLFHRMLLIVTNGTDLYYDYYSYNFPIRFLTDSIEEPIE
ncbi:hypothetical protein DS893_02460 [Vibrionales bacterium C3R12]|nr:hypothetical protein DS893_02460 [Vibrionales bacterium C3R12]